MPNKESQFTKYEKKIEKVVTKSPELGYTEMAKKVIGKKWDYREVDLLRTYIRRNYGHLRDKLRGEEPLKQPKFLIYDLETSRATFKRFWTGKQYLSYRDMVDEPKIITVAWKWLGEDSVYSLTWDKDQCDKCLVDEFAEVYNSADLVIGLNNNSFDNRWLTARAAKYGIPINPYTKSYDIMRQAKKLFRLPSYSMDYMTKYFGVANKLSHEGISMWDKVESGTIKEQKQALKDMVDYNVGDIIATEDLYMTIRKYSKHKIHVGTLSDRSKFSCPECGGHSLKLIDTTTTAAGTIQRIMECQDDGKVFKLSNTEYNKYINRNEDV